MNSQEFTEAFEGVVNGLSKIVLALDQSPDLAGSLTIQDFMLLRDLSRDYLMYHET